MGLLVVTLFSCENKKIENPSSQKLIKKNTPQKVCESPGIDLRKLKVNLKAEESIHFFEYTKKIDALIESKNIQITENKYSKFGSYIEYHQNNKSVKLISEIYIQKLKLASIKHEIYFIDNCNIIAKMTKYAYRSKRIKAIYFYSFHNEQYLGCIVEPIHTFFHKKDKWMNISDEKVAKNWSLRIYNNIIKPHLNSLKGT